MPTPLSPPAVRRGQIQLLMAASATSSFDRFVTGPVLLSLAAGLSVSLSAAASVASLYYLLYGIGQPLWGLCSDRLGRVRTMRLALTVSAAASVRNVSSEKSLWPGVSSRLMRQPA